MTSGSGEQIRLACPDDLEAIGRLLPDLAGPLFPERFPGQTVAEFCHWKYFTNPLGDAAIGVAMAGKRVVSLAAAVPKRVQIGTEVFPAYELGDFITAPEHRKRGLFSNLIKLVCDEALRRGAAFVYVRPNESSFRILTTGLAFVEVQKIDERHYVAPSSALYSKIRLPPALPRALGIDWLARRRLLPRATESITVKQTTHFGRETDELWESTRHRYSLALVRDSPYLNWRYADCPTAFDLWFAYRNGRSVGYATSFVHRSEPTGNIADLFTDPEDEQAAAALLRTAMEAMFAKGVQRVYTWTPQPGKQPAGARALKRACPLVARPHLHVAMRFLDPRMDASRLPKAGWQLAPGDFDGI